MYSTWKEGRLTRGVVTLDCCGGVLNHLTVILAYHPGDISDKPAVIREAPAGLSWGWSEDIAPFPKGHPDHHKSPMRVWLDSLPEEAKKETIFERATPYWKARPAVEVSSLLWRNKEHYKEPLPSAKFCPHCGTPVPEIQRTDNLIGPVYKPSADGDYCATCESRSGCCSCLPPTFLWETVRPEVTRQTEPSDGT